MRNCQEVLITYSIAVGHKNQYQLNHSFDFYEIMQLNGHTFALLQ